jgi:hypothetical protein
MWALMPELLPSATCPQPLRVRSRLRGSSRATIWAFRYGEAGSNRVPISRTGAAVRWVNGPVYRSWSRAGQVAQASECQAHG